MSYPMYEKETSIRQPAGGIIQPHVIPYNNAYVQQPTGQAVVVVVSIKLLLSLSCSRP